jgi:DNA-directed RNA polymerase subunit M
MFSGKKMFCKKCGSIMVPKKENGKTILQCTKCSYKESAESVEIKEKREKEKDVEVVEQDVEAMPIVEIECPECGNDEAYFWTQQTRAGDEPETKFYKCTKCKHTWRDYS